MKAKPEFAAPTWRLKTGRLYAGMSPFNASAVLTDVEHATVYDSRDNAEIKAKFFAALTGAEFEVEAVCAS